MEPDEWYRRGYSRVLAGDLLPSPGVRYCDMHRLPFPDATFDLVYASHVLEHAWDLGRACREIQRVTAEGGWVFAACPVRFRPTTHDRWDVQDVAGLSALFPGPLWQVVWSHGGDTEAAALWRKCPWDKLVEADREARRWATNPLRLLCTVPPEAP